MSGSSHQRLKGILSVTVLKAKNLKKADWFGENDCYVVVSLEPVTMRPGDEIQQTETYQKTQIHDGLHPIFNEKLVFPVPHRLESLYVQVWDSDVGKDDLLGYGTLHLIDDELGGRYDTNLDKEWLHTAIIPLITDDGKNNSTLELVLHYIPESIAAYMGKKFNATQADVKKKITQKVVEKVTGTTTTTEKVRAYVGIHV
ncbi:unnamed protein product [Adineta steineri]|uniref:C2 domain-containing protein n=1 Tax=Adineta steineri TaxID=433720 RepID=A0A814HVR3_9BILA|nr:unnamed protein product [Adineta steineri]